MKSHVWDHLRGNLRSILGGGSNQCQWKQWTDELVYQPGLLVQNIGNRISQMFLAHGAVLLLLFFCACFQAGRSSQGLGTSSSPRRVAENDQVRANSNILLTSLGTIRTNNSQLIPLVRCLQSASIYSGASFS